MSNIVCNINVALSPAKGGCATSRGVSPFRGNPDVAP